MADKTFTAVHRWARIGPRKARLVATMVRGLPVNDAIAVLENSPQRASALLSKVVKSALSNASQEAGVDLNALVISEARVDMGGLLGGRARWRPRAMGRATPIRKQTSHLFIGLSESAERRKRRAPQKQSKAAQPEQPEQPEQSKETETAAEEAAE